LTKLHAAGVDIYFVLTGERVPAATSDQLLPFPQRLDGLVKTEQLKGTGNALLLRDLLAATQKVALKLDN
jgi:hypothetical protein